MNIYTAGIFGGIAITLYVELIICLALGVWATREEADGEEVEEWPEPKVIRFTVSNKEQELKVIRFTVPDKEQELKIIRSTVPNDK